MITGWRLLQVTGIIVICGASLAATSQTHRKHKKVQAPPPPLPSGPTGPIQQIPLDSMAPVPPQVTYIKGQLTIVAANSTLGDVLRAVRKQTGAEIEVPDARERVVTHLGPGPAQEIVADLLNGSRFNYVLLGSPQDPGVLTRVVLVQKSPDASRPNRQTQQADAVPAIGMSDQGQADTADSEPEAVPEEAPAEESGDQATTAEPEQPATQPDQPGVKTPQELLQEMQQRQLQMQQQQPQYPGQPPPPGAVVPPAQPQDNR